MDKQEKRRQENRKINHTRMKEGSYERTLWVATVEQGVTRKDILMPEFWSHVASQLRPYDRLEVRVDDGTYFSELLVLSCDRTWAKLKELSYHSLTTQDVSQTQAEMAKFEVKWNGPSNKFVVIRKSDKAIIKKHMEKDEAVTFLNGYLETIA